MKIGLQKKNSVSGVRVKRTFQEHLRIFIKHFKRDWQLHLIIWIPLLYAIIFNYVPMYGVQIAFRDYNPFRPMMESPWVGLHWIKKFLVSNNFKQLFSNTVILSLYGQFATFPAPIIFALAVHALRQKKYSKFVSAVTYLPNYISTTVMVGIMMMLLSPVHGLYGNIFRAFGGTGYPTDFRATEAAFRHLYVWSGIWQTFGWGSVLYTAALSSVSMELHEAAMIDGASRLQRLRHIDIPSIIPIIVLRLIMMFGQLIGVGFEKTYLLQTNLNRGVSEVIATYIYTYGLNDPNNFSYASAIGLFNNLINISLLIIVNYISKKVSEGEMSLW